MSVLGAEIVYTRSDDTFIPLETRTAIANKAQADLFLSIHANSSPDATARGVETYYLNFTSDATALDVAGARERRRRRLDPSTQRPGQEDHPEGQDRRKPGVRGRCRRLALRRTDQRKLGAQGSRRQESSRSSC